MDIALEGFWIPEFRTIKDEFVAMPTPSDPRRVNVLLGRNGSGKSSLLEALECLVDGQAANEPWETSAVATYRVGAHFNGYETWRGNPDEQMQGLLESSSAVALATVTVEHFVAGNPEGGSLQLEPKDLLDPVPVEEREWFCGDLFGQPPDSWKQSAPGVWAGMQTRGNGKPFTLEQWLVAIAAVPPGRLEEDVRSRPHWQLQVARELGRTTGEVGWNRPRLDTEVEQRDDRAVLDGRLIQRSFFRVVRRWVDDLSSALGQQGAIALVRTFLSRPLVLVGTATNRPAAGYPAFFGLGLRRDDVDGDAADALDSFAPNPDEPSSPLVDGLVQAWNDESPIIRITHPETAKWAPFDLSKLGRSPINWSAHHTWMVTTLMEEEPGGGGVNVEDDIKEGAWGVDLRPAALVPDIISATPQPDGLVQHLEERLPGLHDHVYFGGYSFPRDPSFLYRQKPAEQSLAMRLDNAGFFERMGARWQDPKDESRRAVAHGWCVSGTAFDPSWTGDDPVRPDTSAYLVVRNSVTSVARMISHRANQLAPAFLRSEGWITVEVTPPVGWVEGTPRLSVRLVRSVDADNRTEHATPLEHLSDGLARWVSLVVRLAVIDMEASRWEFERGIALEPSDAGLEPSDATIDISNLPGDASQITPGEFTSRYFDPEFDAEFDFAWVPPHWYLLDAMLNPRRLREYTDDQQQWKNTLILIDEPEVHLHLDAQRSVRDWIGDIAAGNYRAVDPLWTEDLSDTTRSAIVASHSTIFLDYPPETTSTTLVYAETAVEPREPVSLEGFDETTDPEHDNIPVTDGTQQIRTALTPVPEGQDLFQFFKGEQGERLGTSGIDVIALYSGFIIVEGSQDETILEHFYGNELRERRIGVLRAWGTKNAEVADLLTYIGKPVAILVDRAELGPGEKAAVKAFVRSCVNRKLPHWPDRGQPGGHPYPDIIAALPDDAVRAAFPNSTFSGWDLIVDEFEQMRRERVTTGNFKPFATERMGMNISTADLTKRFIKPVLKECGDVTRPREGLELVMNEIICFMANPSADIGSAAIDDEPF